MNDAWSELLQLRSRGGGNTLVVAGAPHARARYTAGLRFPPLPTLFEATLRLAHLSGYERIVACTGPNHGQLPDWTLGAQTRLGDDAQIWEVLGAPQVPSAPAATDDAIDWSSDSADWLDGLTQRAVVNLLWSGMGKDWLDRVEQWLEHRDTLAAQAEVPTLLLVDVDYLAPACASFARVTGLLDAPEASRRLNNVLRSFTWEPDATLLDVVVFGESDLAHLLRRQDPETRFLTACFGPVIRDDASRNVVQSMPHLYVGPSLLARPRRTATALETPLLTGVGTGVLYDALRAAQLRPGAPPPQRPNQPHHIDLRFWAELDLDPLARAFDAEVIGQQRVKAHLLTRLQSFSDQCAELLENNLRAVRTPRDSDFRLPVFGFYGAAGYGKTYLCDFLVRHLMGDAEYGIVVECSAKSMDACTHGIRPPMMGCNSPSELMLWGRRTGGLGVACFDEFVATKGEQNEDLAKQLAAFRPILTRREVTASNPALREADGRAIPLANTIFVFSGNVSPPDTAVPHGFKSQRELGSAFNSRVTDVVWFDVLEGEELRAAAAQAAIRRYSSWAASVERPVPAEIEVHPELIDRLTEPRNGEVPSIRELVLACRRIDVRRVADEHEGDVLSIGPRAYPINGQPDVGGP